MFLKETRGNLVTKVPREGSTIVIFCRNRVEWSSAPVKHKNFISYFVSFSPYTSLLISIRKVWVVKNCKIRGRWEQALNQNSKWALTRYAKPGLGLELGLDWMAMKVMHFGLKFLQAGISTWFRPHMESQIRFRFFTFIHTSSKWSNHKKHAKLPNRTIFHFLNTRSK